MSLLDEWEPSGLSDREAFNRYGTLSPGRQEWLIDLAERVDPDALDPAVLGEAVASFPEEGFLQEVISDLRDIVKDAEPSEIERILERLEELQSELIRDAEYGIEVIRDYQKEVNKL